MGKQPELSPTCENTAKKAGKHAATHAISQYKNEERLRWKKKVISFIFIGLLISILVHINIGFLLSFLMRGGLDNGSVGAITTIEFALEDSQSLSQLPEGQQLQHQESAQTEASTDSFSTTQASLTADASTTQLDSTSQSMAPSLAGGGGMGSGMGGSGGGTSFFGISSSGSRFCYIVDVSGSMQQQERLPSAIAELTNSLKRLPDFARFYVLFYSSQVREDIPSMQKGWNTARSITIRRMTKEFKNVRANGGTRPFPAFEKALALKPTPEVIFFLTDGEISGFTVEMLRDLIPRGARVVVNTIAFGNSASQQQMIDIAKATGGQYKFVQSGNAP